MVQFDHAACDDFLSRFNPGGPWLLYARSLDEQGPMITRKFESTEDAANWAAIMNSEQNPHQIYHQINPTKLSKKPKDVDIVEVQWLQVDIDPRRDEKADKAYVRILKLLTERFPKQVRPPTLVVYSGGGFQVYWKLLVPIEMDGTREAVEDMKGYNKALAALLEGDNCFDLCRIFRTPGSVNWPNGKKRKRGQEPQVAKVIAWYEDRAYNIAEFVKADPSGDAPEDKVSIPMEVPVVEASELEDYRVPPKCLDVIVNGPGPQHASRSEAVFYVACELVRSEVPDQLIYGILTNPMLEISEHILAQPDPRRSAIRQIERAHEYAEDKDLAEMNERFAVIRNYGGKCFVMYEEYDPYFNRPQIALQTKGQFYDAFASLPPVEIGSGKDIRYMARARWWWTQQKRREYEGIVFLPGQDLRGHFNLYTGFSYNPETEGGSCDLFLEHIRENVCKGNETYARYLLGWMARAVQKPGRQGETAIVLRGEAGTGKSFFATHFGALFGRHFAQITDPKHLIGSFNAQLQDCIVLFADEAISCTDKAAISKLKGRITEPTLAIEKKGVDVVSSPNCLHIIMASNEQWVVPVETGDRRFFAIEVGSNRRRDDAYFASVAAELEDKGYSALLRYFLNYELSGYNVRKIPETKEIVNQKIRTLSGEEQWWFDVLCRGTFCDGDDWPTDWIPTDHVFYDYSSFSDAVRQIRKLQILIGRFLKTVVPGIQKSQIIRDHQTYSTKGELIVKLRGCFYKFPPLSTCRKAFEDYLGGGVDWDIGKVLEIEETDEENY